MDLSPGCQVGLKLEFRVCPFFLSIIFSIILFIILSGWQMWEQSQNINKQITEESQLSHNMIKIITYLPKQMLVVKILDGIRYNDIEEF